MLSQLFIQDFKLENPTSTNVGGILTTTWTFVDSFKGRLTRSNKQKIIQLTQGKLERVQPEFYTLYCHHIVPITKDQRVFISGQFYLVNAVYVVHDGVGPHHLSCDITRRH